MYLAAAVPDVGQSLVALAPSTSANAAEDGAEQLTVASDGSIALAREAAATSLFHDCTPERAQAALDRLASMNPVVSTQPVTGAAWRDLTSTFVRCSADRLPELVSDEFLRHDPEIVDLPTGHCPNWSDPQLVADLLAARAEQLSS